MLTRTNKYAYTHTHKFTHILIHTNVWKDVHTHTDVHAQTQVCALTTWYIHVLIRTNLYNMHVSVHIHTCKFNIGFGLLSDEDLLGTEGRMKQPGILMLESSQMSSCDWLILHLFRRCNLQNIDPCVCAGSRSLRVYSDSTDGEMYTIQTPKVWSRVYMI